MKKRFRILIWSAGLLGLALAVWLATMDLDRYRPAVVHSLSQALGHPVSLDRIKLAWRGGPAADLQGLAIFPGSEAVGAPAIRAERVTAGLRLLPLLKGSVQLGTVTVLQPEAEVIRTSAGELRVPGLISSPETAPAPGPGGGEKGPAQAVPFLISILEIRDGTIQVKDESSQPPLAMTLRKLNLTLKNISLNPQGLEKSSAEIRGAIGTVETAALRFPLEQIRWDASLHGNQMELKSLSAAWGAGTVGLSGTIDQIYSRPGGTLKGEGKNLSMESLLPKPSSGQPALRGGFSASFQGSFRGISPEELAEGFSGQAEIQWQEARISGLNVLREVFSKLSIVPGLMETLLARLPGSYQARLSAADTVLEPGDLRLAITGWQVTSDALRLATDSFEWTGSLRVDREGNVDLPAHLRVEPQLSAAMIRSVKDLAFLADEQGRLVLPVVVQGRFPNVVIFPRVEALTQNLLSARGGELIGGLLEKLLEKNQKRED